MYWPYKMRRLIRKIVRRPHWQYTHWDHYYSLPPIYTYPRIAAAQWQVHVPYGHYTYPSRYYWY